MLLTFGETHLFQINTPETIFREISDIYDIRGVTGMPQNFILKLPFQQFNSSKMLKLYNMLYCSICLQVRNISNPSEIAFVQEKQKKLFLGNQ